MGSSGRSIAFAHHPLHQRLAAPAGGLGLLPRPTFRRLLVGPPTPQLAKGALALHLALQDPEGRVDIVLSDKDLHLPWPPFLWFPRCRCPARRGRVSVGPRSPKPHN